MSDNVNTIDIQVTLQNNGLLMNSHNGDLLGRLIDDGKVNFDNLKPYDKKVNNGDFSDGYHTFNELYYHRMILFAVICKQNEQSAWKSWLHHDGTMYDDYFIVGIDTPLGQYSYHYHKKYWDEFDVKELPNAPEWDGHEPKEIEKLLSL